MSHVALAPIPSSPLDNGHGKAQDDLTNREHPSA